MMSWIGLHTFADEIFGITKTALYYITAWLNFLHAIAVLGYLPKLKCGLGLAFDHIFCMTFP